MAGTSEVIRTLNNFYYLVRPFLPRRLQILLRSRFVRWKRRRVADVWPIDPTAAVPPRNWRGWPDGKQFAVVLTHDVDTARGQMRCRELAEIERGLGFLSSFNFVPERYPLDKRVFSDLTRMGFEIGVHGLHHDGKLFKSETIFRRRAVHINRYLQEWQAVGFYAPAMHHNLDWIHALTIEYDASTFDTDPFEPMPNGVKTIFPFWCWNANNQEGYVELPYTLPQDFTLFVLMAETDSRIWRQKLQWIAEKGGMALLNTHPDYMSFSTEIPGMEEYPARIYHEFLLHLENNYRGSFWHALPRDVARYCRHMKPTL